MGVKKNIGPISELIARDKSANRKQRQPRIVLAQTAKKRTKQNHGIARKAMELSVPQ